MKLLSICIPTYNRVASLKNQINQLLPQIELFRDNIELIISNNCSTDKTSEYLFALSQENSWITTNTNEINIGGISNFKKLIEMATGKFVWLLGDDDSLSNDAVNSIMYILMNYRDVSHVFMNYSIFQGEKCLSDKVLRGESVYYDNGLDLFTHVTEECGLGALMFISANIYERDKLLKCSQLLSHYGENHNRAFSLGGSLFCSSSSGYIISNVIIKDQTEAITWSNARIKVFCRDVIAVCDVISKEMGINGIINDLVVTHLPQPYPAIRYMLFNKDKRYDNYTLKWMGENYKLLLLKDYITFPLWAIKVLLAKFIRILKGNE